VVDKYNYLNIIKSMNGIKNGFDIRSHIILTGLTQTEIGKRIGKTQDQISRIASRARNNVEDIEAIFAIPLDNRLIQYVLRYISRNFSTKPAIDHASIISDDKENGNGYSQKNLATLKIIG